MLKMFPLTCQPLYDEQSHGVGGDTFGSCALQETRDTELWRIMCKKYYIQHSTRLNSAVLYLHTFLYLLNELYRENISDTIYRDMKSDIGNLHGSQVVCHDKRSLLEPDCLLMKMFSQTR